MTKIMIILLIQNLKKDFEKEIASVSEIKNEFITNIKNVPVEKLFSKNATYIVMNKNSKTKSYINGIQAEAFLASDNILREKIDVASNGFLCT